MSHKSSSSIFALGFAAALAVALAACAQGAEGTGDGDDVDAARIDAPNNPNIDARLPMVDARPIDAPGLPVDAPIGLPDGGILPDLDGGIGITCTSTAQCTGADACCAVGFNICLEGFPLCLP
jgi:hypothetical protein